jgi:hypothetical protein
MAYQSYKSSDPWVVPSPLEFDALGDTIPLSPFEASYNSIQSASPSLDDQHPLASNTYLFPSWLDSLSSTFYYILQIFPSDESIMEMLSIEEAPWDDNHHRSSFLLSLDEIDKDIDCIFPDSVVDSLQSPILTHDTTSEGNLGNISSTITIDISIKEGIVENVHLDANCSPKEVENYTSLFKEFHNVFAWSYKELPRINPSIIVHEIKTYLGVKPIREKLRPVHPKKTATIKAKVEKLLKSGFIYLSP